MINRLAIATDGFRGNAANIHASIATRGWIADNVGVLEPAGNYTHLWKSLASAQTEEVSVIADARIRFDLPEVFDLRQSAYTPTLRCKGFIQLNIEDPAGGVMVTTERVISESTVNKLKARCGARSGFVRGETRSYIGVESPAAGAIPAIITVNGKTFHAYWTPETVQNPTEEMILIM